MLCIFGSNSCFVNSNSSIFFLLCKFTSLAMTEIVACGLLCVAITAFVPTIYIPQDRNKHKRVIPDNIATLTCIQLYILYKRSWCQCTLKSLVLMSFSSVFSEKKYLSRLSQISDELPILNEPIDCQLIQVSRRRKQFSYEPVHKKTNNLGFRPGLTQTRLHSHRSRLEA